MNTSKNIISRKYKTDPSKSQDNLSVSNPIFNEFYGVLVENAVTPKNRSRIFNTLRKLTNEQVGKVVIRMLPYLPVKTPSYREYAKLTGYSHWQIREWVNKFAPELFIERSRGGAK